MKKKKGIWNKYKGILRGELQKYCRENNIGEDRFKFLNVYTWQDVYKEILNHFTDGKCDSIHWLNINMNFNKNMDIFYSFDCREMRDWFYKIPEIIEKNDEKAYILFEDIHKYWLAEGDINILPEIIGETYRDYYIVDKKYKWLITCNHHDVVLFVGEGLNYDRIKEITEIMR